MGRNVGRGMTEAEAGVLKMIQDLYGRQWHKRRDCYKTEGGSICIFIKDKGGAAQFSVDLTLLGQLRQVLDSGFKETHLMRQRDAA
jgi:hypothetical protein